MSRQRHSRRESTRHFENLTDSHMHCRWDGSKCYGRPSANREPSITRWAQQAFADSIRAGLEELFGDLLTFVILEVVPGQLTCETFGAWLGLSKSMGSRYRGELRAILAL